MIIKGLYFLFSKLPNTLSQLLGVAVGHLFYYTNNREKRVASTNIKCCFPMLSEKQQQQLVKKTLIENVKTLFEIPRIYDKGGEYAVDLIKEVSGLAHYQKALSAEKGIIIMTPHLGNWELVIHYVSQFLPPTVMFAPSKVKDLDAIMKAGRQKSGATLVPADTSGVRALLKTLQAGGVIGILPDQRPKHGHAAVFAPFMGMETYTMLLVNRLAKRTDATLFFMFAERLDIGKGYKLHIIPASKDIGDSDELTAATALNEGLEQCVKVAPAQYQWTYKRFNKQPTGYKSPYS